MRKRSAAQEPLFDTSRALPNGFFYTPEFVSRAEEEALIRVLHTLPLVNAPYKEYTANRRIMNFGWSYDEHEQRLVEGMPLPDFLRPLRTRIAARLAIPKDHIVEALITEYSPGTRLGWHCDNESFQKVIGISLGSWCTMELRPLRSAVSQETYALTLEPRSLYCMQEESRWAYQHRVLPTAGERYSITFRTLPTF